MREASRHGEVGRRPRIKICGITRPEDAERAIEVGVDLLGLNFYPPSPRCLEVEGARRIAERVAGRATLVGVFVNRAHAEIEEIAERVGLDLVQLHGDERFDEVRPLAARAIRAFRIEGGWSPAELDRWPGFWGYLFEGRHPELYGGGGQRWPYEMIADLAPGRRVLVAGGIDPGNVAEALARSRAWGVDVCSGVESAPGIKDPDLLEQLVREVDAGDGHGERT